MDELPTFTHTSMAAVTDFFGMADSACADAESAALIGGEAAIYLGGPHNPREFAQRLYAFEALYPSVPRRVDEQPEPYSLQWFLDIQNQRHSKHGRWIPRLLEFAKHSGETLLGLGHGLGTDWVQYAPWRPGDCV